MRLRPLRGGLQVTCRHVVSRMGLLQISDDNVTQATLCRPPTAAIVHKEGEGVPILSVAHCKVEQFMANITKGAAEVQPVRMMPRPGSPSMS